MYQIRVARLNDCEPIERLIQSSVRGLAVSDYSQEQIEAALVRAWGLDTQLIKDETYFVVENDEALVACGGWSFRQTLFGNDSESARNAAVADPRDGAAKIRAFFVHPDHARQGIGSMLMQKCEAEAIEYGFRKLELMATLPGKRFYERHGFQPGNPIDYELDQGLVIEFVPMTKCISDR